MWIFNLQKEKISRNKGVQPATQAEDFVYRHDSDEDCTPEDTLKDIDDFETKKRLKCDNDSDSDWRMWMTYIHVLLLSS